jgi:HAD superfamily hydrolase (TIGR01456 family)
MLAGSRLGAMRVCRAQLHAPAAPPARTIGYVLDIDGVLLRGSRVLPAGVAALRLLYDASAGRYRAPVAFLTNGGGTTEAARAARLSRMLAVPVSPSQVVLAHSPMRAHAAAVPPNRAVVTVGGPACVDVARGYGFSNVLDIARAGQAAPAATPFAAYDGAPPLTAAERELAALPVGAVLVMSDSGAALQRDLQLLVDYVEEDESVRPEPVTIIFANPDVTFPSEHPRPRLAGGVLRVALDAVLAAHAHARRTDYRAVQLGKPMAPNYALAEAALLAQVPHAPRAAAAAAAAVAADVFDAIYMCGDNPASDVRGARTRGRPWRSVLVRSGNFSGADNCAEDPADHVVDDVHEAVARSLDAPRL